MMLAPIRRAAAAVAASASSAAAPLLHRRGLTSTRPLHRSGSSNSSPGVGSNGNSGKQLPFPPPPPPPPFTPIPLDTVVDSATERGRLVLEEPEFEPLWAAYRRALFSWRTLAYFVVGGVLAAAVYKLGPPAFALWQLAKDEAEEAEFALKHRDAQGWRDGGAPMLLPSLSDEDEAAAEAAKTPEQRKEEARERRELLEQLKQEQPAAERRMLLRSKWLASHADVYTLGLEPAAEAATPDASLSALLSFVADHPLPGSPLQFKTDAELQKQFQRGTSNRPDPPQISWKLLQHVEALSERAQFLISHPKGWNVSDQARLALARDLLREAVVKRTQLLQYIHLHALRFPRELQPLSMIQSQFTALGLDLAALGREAAVERVINEGIKPLAGLALARLEKNGRNHPHAMDRTRAHFNDAIVSAVGTLCEQAQDWVEASAYRRASLSNKLVILGLVTGDETQAAEEEEDQEVMAALELAAANSQRLSEELTKLSYIEAAASQTPEALSLPAASLASARAQSVIHAAQAVELAQYRLMRELGPDNEAELSAVWTEEEAARQVAEQDQARKEKQQERMQKQLQAELKKQLAAANVDDAAAAAAASAATNAATGSPIDPVAALAATASALQASSSAASASLSPEAALEEQQLEGMFALLNTNLPLTLERPFLEERVGSPAMDPNTGAAVELEASKDKLWQAQELAEEQSEAREAVAAVIDDAQLLAAVESTLRSYVGHLSAAHDASLGWGWNLLLSSAGLRLQIAQTKDSLARPYAQLAHALEIQGETAAAKRARDIAERIANIEPDQK